MFPVSAGERFDWEDKLTTTLMKKLLSLAMLALVAVVIVGCKPKEGDTGAPSTTSTNKP